MAKQRVRDVLRLAVERGYVEGGDRQPLHITPSGADWLKCFPVPPADAIPASKSAPRNKG